MDNKFKKLNPDVLADIVVRRYRRAQEHRRNLRILNNNIDEWFRLVNMAFNKVHEPEQTQSFPGLSRYFWLTGMKVNTAVAHLKNKYSHALELPVVLTPSEKPDLPPERKKEASILMMQQIKERLGASGLNWEDVLNSDGISPLVQRYVIENKEKIKELMRESELIVARQIADIQSKTMKEQLDIGGWGQASLQLLHNLVLEPYACIRAGHLEIIRVQNWRGKNVENEVKSLPAFRCLRGIDCYHAPDATSAQDGDFFIHLAERTRYDLVSLKSVVGEDGAPIYYESQIDKVLEHYDAVGQDWLNLNNNHSLDISLNGIRYDSTWAKRPNTTIPVLIHEGTFLGSDLENYISGLDPSKKYEVEVEVCGNVTIRCNLTAHPNNERTYYSTAYNRMNDSYAGVSVAMALRDRQLEVNMLLAAKNRNAWHSSGPTYEVNSGYFRDPSDATIEPFKFAWIDGERPGNNLNFGMRPHEIRPTFAALHEEIRRVMVLADEECGVPSLFSGVSRGGVSRTTLGGAVLEQTNGEKMMDAAIMNLDKFIIEPMVKSLYKYNVIYGEFEMRGDLDVIGRGISGLRDEELRRRAMQSNIPLLMQTTQQGLTPKPMLESALRDYYGQTGFDVSSMPGQAASAELSNLNIAPAPQPDARTYVPESNRYGVPSA